MIDPIKRSKVASIDLARTKGQSVATACKQFRCTPGQYYLWKKANETGVTEAPAPKHTTKDQTFYWATPNETIKPGTCTIVRCQVSDLSQVIQAIQ